MSLLEWGKSWSRQAFHGGNNKTTLFGLALTTSSGITLAWFWALEILSPKPLHGYVGILLFLILPGIFAFGLGLMPFGVWLRRRKLRKAGELPVEYPKVDFSQPLVRRALILVGLLTFANVAIMGTATYKGIEFMDSTQFCGLACHSVMAPEYTAFIDSPHARVGCAQCHIGPGAGWFVKSKLSGTRQLLAVTFGTFSRPIPSPVTHLRPARDTCEQCHWPQKMHDDKILVRTKYAEDEANTPATTVLMLRIGGRVSQGIHGRHLDATERISYVASDPRRQEIAKVIYRDDQGKRVEYLAEGAKPEALKGAERKMDCVDCHNRPTHAFELPDQAMDKAMGDGRIAVDLPFIKKLGVETLKKDYATRDAAAQQIPQLIRAFYEGKYPELMKTRAAQVNAAAEAIKAIHLRNVWPDMKLVWGTHPNQIGHAGNDLAGGCYRCHDGNHKAADGRVITSDCSACHQILAQDEKDPKILKDMGMR